MKKIYILFSCNEWKECNSMELIMASTSERKIRAEIKRQIKEGNMEYNANKNDLKEMDLDYINNSLQYGYVMIVIDGEKEI